MVGFCLNYLRLRRVFLLLLLLRRVFLRLPPTLTFELFALFELFELFAFELFFATFADAFTGAFIFRAFIDPFVDGDAFVGFCVDPEAPIFLYYTPILFTNSNYMYYTPDSLIPTNYRRPAHGPVVRHLHSYGSLEEASGQRQ